MADEGQRRSDPGDTLRDGVRAVSGILGAFKDAIEQTFSDLSERGEISPERARDAARDAMRRAQEAMDDMRGRVDFVTRREFDTLRAEVAALRTQLDAHVAASTAAHAAGAGGTGGTAGGAAGGSAGDGSPGL